MIAEVPTNYLFIYLFIETYLYRIKTNQLKLFYIEVLLDFAISNTGDQNISVLIW